MSEDPAQRQVEVVLAMIVNARTLGVLEGAVTSIGAVAILTDKVKAGDPELEPEMDVIEGHLEAAIEAMGRAIFFITARQEAAIARLTAP